MRVDGQCHCGAITYEAEVEPDTIGICHCLDCQRLTGSAFRANILAPADSFRILTGSHGNTSRLAAVEPGVSMHSARFAAHRSIPAQSRIRRPIPCASVR